jgi:hypothetical protein
VEADEEADHDAAANAAAVDDEEADVKPAW